MITGASSGLGKKTAQLFQQQGWNVIATMRSPEKEQELNQHQNVLVLKLDVQDKSTISEAVKAGKERFGTIDVLVNNAGFGSIGTFESATDEHIQKQFAVNVFGAMHVTQAVLPVMRQQGSGTIINISTFGGITTLPFSTLYNSSKFALEGFSEALSHEVFKLGIGVKIVEPGGVNTNFRNSLDMIPNDIEAYQPLFKNMFANYTKMNESLTRATPQDVAQAILTAATDGSSKLRYVVGEDAQFYVDLKMKNSEADFLTKLRAILD